MVKLLPKFIFGFIILITPILGVVNAADIIFTAPPREKPAAGMKIYGPIAKHISKLINAKVVYKHPGNWLKYQRDMRDGKYDIIFDGPHFASWRMAHLGHDMLVRVPGTLGFVLVIPKSETTIKTINDLIGKPVCGVSMPNLSTLSILAAYPNPVRQPVIIGLKGGMKGVAKAMSKNRCKAYVFRDKFFMKKLKAEVKNNFSILYKSKALPNQVITVSRRITPAAKKAIVHSLTLGDGVDATRGLLKRFAGKARAMIKATNKEFKGHNMLLEGVIFGW